VELREIYRWVAAGVLGHMSVGEQLLSELREKPKLRREIASEIAAEILTPELRVEGLKPILHEVATKSDLNELERRMKAEIEGLEERIGGLEERIGKLEERVGKLEERVGKLEERVGKLEERVGKLEERVGKLEESVGKLEERIGGLEERVGGVEGRLREVERGQLKIAEAISELRGMFVQLNKRMDDLYGVVKASILGWVSIAGVLLLRYAVEALLKALS